MKKIRLEDIVLKHSVGVFDSGIGGLTVLNECVRLIPDCRYYYYGDNARAPYGSRSKEEIIKFVREGLEEFQKLGVSAAVLACNTATAVCADLMRREFSFPVVGVEPAVKRAAALCRNVLVIATPRTAESERIKLLIDRFPECKFTVYAAPDLAAAVERAVVDGETLTLSDHLPEGHYDGIVLGCTHYSYFREEIARFYGTPAFDGNFGTAKRLQSILHISAEDDRSGTADHLLTTDLSAIYLTKSLKKGKKSEVFFLGSGKNANKRVFLQTFVLHKNKK